MCGAYCCAGAPLVIVGSRARVDSAGWPACELCGARLNRVKHHRAYGPGRACTLNASHGSVLSTMPHAQQSQLLLLALVRRASAAPHPIQVSHSTSHACAPEHHHPPPSHLSRRRVCSLLLSMPRSSSTKHTRVDSHSSRQKRIAALTAHRTLPLLSGNDRPVPRTTREAAQHRERRRDGRTRPFAYSGRERASVATRRGAPETRTLVRCRCEDDCYC